jgi:hypothetical protein
VGLVRVGFRRQASGGLLIGERREQMERSGAR